MVGKALYEGILLGTPLAPFFVTRLQGRRPILEDLTAMDPALHRSLQQVWPLADSAAGVATR